MRLHLMGVFGDFYYKKIITNIFRIFFLQDSKKVLNYFYHNFIILKHFYRNIINITNINYGFFIKN